jgi:ferredoxin
MAHVRKVILDRAGCRERVLQCTAEETILEAAEAHAIRIPFGCRTGACASCVARLRKGRIDHRRRPRGLKPHHLVDGYVLTCIAVPRGDCRLDVGPTIQRELVSNPWR